MKGAVILKNATKIILTMTIGIFLCMLDTTVMNIALPAIQTGLNTDLAHLSWALNIYTVLFASLTIPLGRLADVWGRGRLYLLGLVLFLMGSLASGLSTTVTLLIVGRGIQSIGAAIVFPASMTIGIQSVSVAKRTSAIALLGVTQGLAAALGPTIGGAVTQFLGWRGIFLINVPLALVAIGLSVWLLDWRSHVQESVKLDIAGSGLIMITLLSLTLLLVKGSDWGWMSRSIMILAVVSIISLGVFIWTEAHVAQPMVPLALFKDRQFNGAALATVLSGIFLVGLMVLMPSFFTKVQNYSELMAAIMITPASVMIFILSPISGLLLAKLGPRLVILVGSIAMIVGYVVISVMNANQYWQFAVAAVLLGAGYGIIIGPITVLAAGDFTGELLTASQSVIGVFRQIGTSLAVAIFVSALAANLTTAKARVQIYATQTISALSVSKQVKTDALTTVHRQLAAEQSASKTTAPITPAKTKRLIATNYEKVLKQRHLQQAPANVKTQVHQKVAQQVTKQVATMNQQLMTAITGIKAKTKTELTVAFIKPYQVALPFTLLLILVSLCFERQQRHHN